MPDTAPGAPVASVGRFGRYELRARGEWFPQTEPLCPLEERQGREEMERRKSCLQKKPRGH